MNEASKMARLAPQGVEETVERYVANSLLPRLLMRFWNTDRPFDLVRDIAEPLRIHASEARTGLRELICDGFVVQRNELDRTSYFLTKDPSARALVGQVLRRAIEQRSPR
jgi:hypothetical protein